MRAGYKSRILAAWKELAKAVKKHKRMTDAEKQAADKGQKKMIMKRRAAALKLLNRNCRCCAQQVCRAVWILYTDCDVDQVT